ncbi:MAG: hypothetical protein COX46_03350 [bacterium (Candidatus Ratteibacteria) CG23_combo_of_CG06-09_8_20_14_all_48_7]|uniref:Uncharacterized protein n=1 Tax=bacterium (Candidatus Ratteibacteria) CG23_combo_of_CG06-09_8_20_14_all_48_7 TaxID=2014292 RepID=A0A2G9YAJ5_9BACT|nr:MAG: hypothetical protein COX46_03350 [bacterium (Candidatus Ratteibacteria) CG23_combo_of_CG06-09_8_20_14_all_48_7]
MWLSLILLSFFFEGLLGVAEKMVRELNLGEMRNDYIFLYNLIAAFIGGLFLIRERERPGSKDLFIGSLIGLAFYFAAFFCLQAILELPGIIYFSVAGVGGILLVTSLSHLIWREKLKKKQVYGLTLACLSLVLLTI